MKDDAFQFFYVLKNYISAQEGTGVVVDGAVPYKERGMNHPTSTFQKHDFSSWPWGTRRDGYPKRTSHFAENPSKNYVSRAIPGPIILRRDVLPSLLDSFCNLPC